MEIEGVVGTAEVTTVKIFEVAVQVGLEVEVTVKVTVLVAALAKVVLYI